MAQSGTISGQVTDPNGASVPDAVLRLIDTSSNSTRTSTSNEVGRYTFMNVPPGNYDLTVTKEGFTAAKTSGRQLEVGGSLTLDFAMQLGSTSLTLEVVASSGAELQTLNSTVGSTIQNDALNLLPNLGRDAASFTILQVGVGPGGDVAGANRDQSKFELDGGNNSDDLSGSDVGYNSNTAGSPSGVVPTPVESVEEIKIATSGQTADFNSAAGSQVQMVTKRGTAQFHGTLYEFYFGSNVGAANSWANNHTPSKTAGLPYTPLPSTHRNRFGFALGGPLAPRFWGGKTFFFVNYEGMRYPNVTNYTRQVPTPLMRAGVITLPNSSGVQTAYNLNAIPVTVNGVTYQPAQCGSGICDPRGIGMNSLVSTLWSQLPQPNDPNTGDGVNIQGYRGTLALPQSSNFFVARVDHDFGDRWKFFSSYRYYSLSNLAQVQTILSPDGQVKSVATQPQKPSYMVAGLTTTITNHLTSDFRVSYLRNWWEWGNAGAPPQFPGLGGALEVGGELGGNGSTYQLQPMNVNTVAMRQRFWNGQDKNLSESMSYLRGNHLFQFGGSYLRTFGDTGRDDNGQGTDFYTKYQIATSSGISNSAYPTPTGLASSQIGNWALYYSEVLGIVGQTIGAATRSGANLNLNPPNTPVHGKSVYPVYNFYFTDTWHLKPTVTLSYGLSYGLSMPPTELFGTNVTMTVDSTGKPIYLEDYFAQKKKAALAGQVYDPQIGFSLLQNVGNGRRLTDPYYGGFGPRISVAWNPNFDQGILGAVLGHGKSVIRGGYSRIIGRANGVEQILAPVAGNGPFQPLSCLPTSSGTCAAATSVTPATAFRIGTDGMSAPLPPVTQTLPQPFFPGVNGASAISDSNLLDPGYRPSSSDQVNFSIQRALSQAMTVEAGYIGRRIRHVNQQINIDAVPWMTTLGGQSFAQAFGAVFTQLCGLGSPACANTPSAVTPQPFFEAALGGPTSVFCAKFSSCTAAVVSNYAASIRTTQVYSLWQSMSLANGWALGRTLLSSPAIGGSNIGSQINSLTIKNSMGWGNYNAAYLKVMTKNWRGLTATSNLTWGRSLGTQANDTLTVAETVVNPWDLRSSYGPQSFDIKLVYNLMLLYRPTFFKAQKGLLGHVLGGWSVSPLLTARSGSPLRVSTGTGNAANCQAFGESYGNVIQGRGENAVAIKPYNDASTLRSGVTGSNGVGTSGTTGLNIFADPAAVYAGFRPPVLGVDTNMGGAGPLRGFPSWNVDATASKELRASERFSGTLLFMFTNVLNHMQPSDPSLSLNSPQTWGVVTSSGGARSVEFGLRIKF